MAKYIHIYIYIYVYIYILYVYVSNQIQQNKMQPEHVSEVKRSGSILRFVCVRSAQSFTAKRSANVCSRSPVNRMRSNHALTLNVSSKIRHIYFFLFIVTLLNKCLN